MNPLPSLSTTVVDGAFAHDYAVLKPSFLPGVITISGIAATLAAALHDSHAGALPDFAAWSCILSLAISLASALWITPRSFCPGFLISLLPFMIAWRVAAMNGAMWVETVAGIAFVSFVAQFVDCAIADRRRDDGRPGAWLGTLLWQMTFVRLVFGLNELGHATEKIFAGHASFVHLVAVFHGFGIGDAAAALVILGGLTELVSAISVGLGLFARLGAVISVVYFLVATIGFGGEWTRGYAWATAGGGGWEYVLLLLTAIGSVVLTGAGKFSLDGWLLQRGKIPRALRPLCVNRAVADA